VRTGALTGPGVGSEKRGADLTDGADMRTFSLALLSPDPLPATGSVEVSQTCVTRQDAHGAWWDALFRHWPAGVPAPRLEPLTEEGLAGRMIAHAPGKGEASGPVRSTLDAVVLGMFSDDQEAAVCRVLDALQHAQVPALLLVDGPGAHKRMEAFHPGSVLVRGLHDDPAATAAMLFALASRQAAVRSMEQNLRLAQSFQGETAAEIDRLHQELLLAARVQRDFMPKAMPCVEGVQAAVLFRPAGFVSGDTYDVYRLDEHRVGFFIADAMGHGVPAALMTLYISGSLPRKEITPDGYRIVPPGEALTRLNNSLQECLAGPARFVTAICGVIDTRTGVIDLACAGHPPPLKVGPHGARAVEVSGMLLGVVGDYQYEQVSVRLDEDEMLVMHSDGVESAFAPRASAGAEGESHLPPAHVRHLAAMGRGEGAADVGGAIRRLAADLDAQSGSLHQDDDLTVLVVKAVAVGAEGRGGAAHDPGAAVGVGGR
jgi:serine phosphatase RsbU (regulator of sigma subunit)